MGARHYINLESAPWYLLCHEIQAFTFTEEHHQGAQLWDCPETFSGSSLSPC